MAGNPWDSDPIVQPAPRTSPGVPPPPQNQRARKNEADIFQTGASATSALSSAGKSQFDVRQGEALLPSTLRKAEADAAAAEAKAENDAREAKRAEKAAKTGAFTLRESTDEMLSNIRNARRRVTPWATGWGSLMKGVPETDALSLREALAPIKANIMLGKMKELKESSRTGATGFGNQTEREGKALESSISSLDQARSAEEVAQSLAAVERHYRRFYAFTRGENPDEPKVAARYGIFAPSAKPPGEPPSGPLTGEQEEVRPAELQGLNTTVSNMLRSGVSSGEIRDFLNEVQPTLGDRAKNIEWYEDYYRQNPNGPLEPRMDIERYFKPKEGLARTVGEIAQSPVGAGVIGASDVVTGGLLDEMTSNPALSRAVMSSAQEENPGAYLTGQVLGGVTGTLGVGAGTKALGLGLSPETLAMLEGGVYGFGSADSDSAADRLAGAGLGALTGKYGQRLVGAATRGVGNVAGGVKNKSVELLDKYGVPLTIGELVGGGAARVEQKLGRIPFGIGVNSRQQESLEGFNKAAFDFALEPIGSSTSGETGVKGIQAAKQQLGDFYDTLLQGKQFSANDPTFQTNTQQLLGDIAALPDIGAPVLKEINKQVGDLFDPTRTLSGTDWQRALRDLKAIGSKYKDADLGPALRTGIDGLVTEFSDLATRQAPDIAEGLGRANDAYRRYSILKDAVRDKTNKEVGLDVFLPETLLQKSEMNAERFGGRGVSAEGQHPFYELSRAGIDVLTPARERSRDTPFILSTGTGLGAGTLAHFLQPPKGKEGETEGRDPVLNGLIGAGAGLALSAPYSKLMQKYIQKGLAGPRSAGAKAAGDFFRDKLAPVAGGGITAPLIDLYQGNLPNTSYDPNVSPYVELPDGIEPSPTEAPAKGPLAVEADDEGFITLQDGTRILVTQRR